MAKPSAGACNAFLQGSYLVLNILITAGYLMLCEKFVYMLP